MADGITRPSNFAGITGKEAYSIPLKSLDFFKIQREHILMLRQLLKDQSQKDIQVYLIGEAFFEDSLGNKPLPFLAEAALERRLFHYAKWCDQHAKSFRFQLIEFDNEGPGLKGLKFRDALIQKSDQGFCVDFYKPESFEHCPIYKSLSLFDNVNDMVLVSEAEPIDEPGPRVIYANPAFMKETEFSQAEILGKNPRMLQGPESSDETRKNIREGLKHWRSFRQEINNYKKSGKPFTVELSISPVADETGWWTHWVSFQRDITKERLAHSSFERLQQIGKIGYWSYNIKTQETSASKEAYQIYGLPLGAPMDVTKALSYYAPHDRQRMTDLFQSCIENKSRYDAVFDFIDEKGKSKKVRTTGEPLIEASGSVYNVFGIIQDITEQETEHQEYQELIDNNPAIIYKLDDKGHFTFVNSTWKEQLEHSPNEVIGKHFHNFVHPDDLELCVEALKEIVTGKKETVQVDYRVYTKSGQLRYHRTQGTRHIGGDYSLLGVAIDITEENSFKTEIEKRRAQVITQSKLASIGELAAGVGHEINNPLTIAQASIEKLKKQVMEKNQDLTKKVETSLKRIAKITDGLWTLSRKQTDKGVFDMKTLIHETLFFIKDIFENDGIHISLKLNSDSDNLFQVEGDKTEVQQVLMNLLTNARDATDQLKDRHIEIALKKTSDQIVVQVTDNGAGIKPEYRDKVFESFFTTKEVGKGTGLGLPLSYQIVKNHGGELSFTDGPQKMGTTFEVRLPQSHKTVSEVVVEKTVTESELCKFLHILVADDEEDILEIFSDHLDKLNCTYELALNGEDAFKKILQSSKAFDLVISDMKMPKLSGPELLKKVRNESRLKAQPRFLFVTGGSVQQDHFHNKGDLSHEATLTKPFTQEELVQGMNQLFAESS